jgi:hypothetical protein
MLLLLSVALAQEGTVSFGAGTPDYYIIQEGDTLWDISTRFLGDPYAWPELWSINGYVTNPHWIYPGERIYFRLSESLPPPQDVAIDTTPPPPEAAVCDFPPRFNQERPSTYLFAPGTLGNDRDLNIQGTVYGAYQPNKELAEDHYLYLKVDGDQVECGDQLAIYRKLKSSVKNDRRNYGNLYWMLGTVRVLRVDRNIATVVVEISYAEMERGDLVGDPMPVGYTVDVHPPNGEVLTEASVVARLGERVLVVPGETVFLDRGTNDGIEPGISLYIVRRVEGRLSLEEEDERVPERVIGRVVVVRAEEGWSTAVVVDAENPLPENARLTSIPNSN